MEAQYGGNMQEKWRHNIMHSCCQLGAQYAVQQHADFAVTQLVFRLLVCRPEGV
jgi:hypothetical protein